MGIIKWLRGSQDTEQRSQLTDPSWWLSVFTGSATESGQKVTPDTALHQPAVFACIRIISEDVASLPIKVYSRTSNGGRQEIENHPVAKLFHSVPNTAMTPFTFKETLTAHVLLYGNAYAEIERNGAGVPIALWILFPDKMQIVVHDGIIQYRYQSSGGQVVFDENQILHLRGLGNDGILGYSPIQYAKETIGISAAMEQSGGAFFSNSSRPSGILSHPAKLSEDASKRLREGWGKMYEGSGNVGRTAILEEGMEWKQLSIPHSDSEWLEARRYALQDICRIYRVPPHLAGDLSRATFSNIESQQISYMQQTLMPWLRRWEQEINRKLISADDRSVYAEFLAEEALRGNTIDRYAAYRTARETGWLSVNEIRKRENLPPIAGGDSFVQPLNFIDSEIAKEVQQPQASSRAWLGDSINRSVAIIRNTSNRKADRATDDEWKAWLVDEDFGLLNKVEEILSAACTDSNCNATTMAQVLIGTWRSAVEGVETRQLGMDACNNWAKSFKSDASIGILIERSQTND